MNSAQVSSDFGPSWSEDSILLYNSGEFVAVFGRYKDGNMPVVGIRWSANYDKDTNEGVGFPQAFGHPLWFVLPGFLTQPTLHTMLEQAERNVILSECRENISKAIRIAARQVRPNDIQFAIAFYGAAGTGKTTTLNILIDLLVAEAEKDGFMEDVRIWDGGSYDEATKTGDRCVAVRVFGKMVVVATFGDNGDFVASGIAFARSVGADILVIATRKRSDSSSWGEFWKEIAEKGIPYAEVEKIKVDETDAQVHAAKQARELFEMICKA
ncbi:MAG: hypothetical protein IJV65_04115 [Kiritimatiellae bacterium]|nr:hypothetical protein [Kiritimatiellia bacterium]